MHTQNANYLAKLLFVRSCFIPSRFMEILVCNFNKSSKIWV